MVRKYLPDQFFALHLNYVGELLFLRDVAPSPLKLVAVRVKERNRVDGPESSFCRTRAAAPEVSIRRSTVCHDKAKSSSFACRNIAEKDMAWSYYGSLAYAHLGKKSQMTKRYGKWCMEVMAKPICSCALEMSDVATDNERQKHQVWVDQLLSKPCDTLAIRSICREIRTAWSLGERDQEMRLKN